MDGATYDVAVDKTKTDPSEMEENVLLDTVSTFKRPLRDEDPKGQPFGKVPGVVVAVVVVVPTVVVCNISSPIVKASPSCLEDISSAFSSSVSISSLNLKLARLSCKMAMQLPFNSLIFRIIVSCVVSSFGLSKVAINFALTVSCEVIADQSLNPSTIYILGLFLCSGKQIRYKLSPDELTAA
jgi:hypothetical protein